MDPNDEKHPTDPLHDGGALHDDGSQPGGLGAASDRPAWLIATAIGIPLLLVVGLLVFFISGNDDAAAPLDSTPLGSVDDSAPAATEVPVTEAPAATGVPATDPAATDVPPATDAPRATDTPATTVAPSAPDGPTAAPLESLAPGEASVATPDGVVSLNAVVTCSVTPFVGARVRSSLLTGAEGSVFLLDFVTDEGGQPGIVLSSLDGEIATSLFGQDNSAGSYWFAANPALSADRLTLDPLGGAATGTASMSYNAPAEDDTCATGFVGFNWPFTDGDDPAILDQFDERLNGSNAFAVLAECAGGLLLSERGILLDIEFDGMVDASLQLTPERDQIDFWSSQAEPQPSDVLIEQQGGGGDVTYVVRVEDFVSGAAGYLTWTRQPTVDGGLKVLDVPC